MNFQLGPVPDDDARISRSCSCFHHPHDDGHRAKTCKTTSAELRRPAAGKCPTRVKSRSKTGQKTKEPEYNAEAGYVRTFLQGHAVKSYLPTDYDGYSLSAKVELPTEKLQLEWVYGYRGRDCRSNLHLLSTGEIIYFIAAVVVIHNVEEGRQRHYVEHNSEVKSIAIHPNKVIIATGQRAGHDKDDGKPHVRVWDSITLNTLRVIGLGMFDRGICCVGFSKDDGGSRLVAVDDSYEHVLSVWGWENNRRLAFSKSTINLVFAAEFHPTLTDQIVSCGKKHFLFWNLDGAKLVKKPGTYRQGDYCLCVAFASNGDVLAGDSSGNIHIWGKGSTRVRRVISTPHIFRPAIFSLLVLSDDTLMSGGGKDGKVISYNSSYKVTGQIEIPEEQGFVRTLCQGKDDNIFVGTTHNSILHGDMNGHLTAIVQTHSDELWGLATHPNQDLFLTSAYDKQVILWDMEQYRPQWKKGLKDPCHSATFHPSASVLAIGMTTGRWVVLDTESKELVYECTDGTERHNIIKYSPDGNLIAIASQIIYVYTVGEDGRKYSKVGRCSGHASFVTHIDWSADSEFLQSNSGDYGDYELLYWNAKTCKQVTSATTMRDTDWATFTCVRGFPVVGIWPEGTDGTDINTVSRSNNRNILATGDNFGKVNLFRYPVTQPKAPHHVHTAHSNVTNVLFTTDGRRLISTGGRDMSCMQWKVQ